ncbi:MAG: DnaJ domain-containing protein [Rhodospirillales bacterium]|nr:DnaJ domain-containing protein [Rhodospirillales bacterium]MCB9964977.1 DnaJ domain-containing protein [Rhodospirillales bacterium]MCB9973431.1 DnaJ domain-containing protein [Rhodospirillales bacterium]MCB9980434.1 DnaJ domain-containing protein [Rhodospirillales bacterium]
MPKIQLKPNSPEYEDFRPRKKARTCDMPDCHHTAEFKAPKDRTLKDYYHLCQEHITAYNKAWNFFAEMSEDEIQSHMRESVYGHRPTWKYGASPDYAEELYRKAQQTYSYRDSPPPGGHDRYRKDSEGKRIPAERTPETDAMRIMELSAPLTLQGIKARYKELAKKYHPDLNSNNKEAEEKLKEVNMAYTILKIAYEKFEKLEQNPE